GDLHRWRGDAEHGGPDQWPVTGLGDRAFRVRAGHARDRGGGVAEDLPGYPVDPGDVHHAVGHGHVFRPDIRGDVTGGHGGEDELRHADRQVPHGAGGDRRTTAATHREYAVQAP